MTEIQTWQPSNDVAVSTSQDVAVQRLGEWAQSADAAYNVAMRLVESSFVPASFRNKPIEACAAILAGIEVGLSPMAALRSFDVIQGQAAARAITLRAVVQSHGHEMILIESTESRCRMKGKRKGSDEWQTVTWTLDRAKALGLTGKDNWKKQPGAMLVARATSELARLIASDAILGIGYSAEEIADGGNVEARVAAETVDSTPTGTRRMSRPKREPEAEATPEPEPRDEPLLLDPKSDLAKAMFATYNELEVDDRDERLRHVSRVVGREVSSSSEMTEDDARAVLRDLDAAKSGEPNLLDPASVNDSALGGA